MKKLVLCFVALFAFSFASAFAQDNSQGTAGSSPAASQGSSTMQNNDQTGGTAAQSGSASGQSGSMSSDNMHKDKGMMKGEKTIKGCIQSQNGQYMLEEHGGKMVNLSGSQDMSAMVGHTVKVHGSYASGGDSSAPKTFNVSSIDSVSDTCSMGGKMGKKDKMGNPGNTTQPQ